MERDDLPTQATARGAYLTDKLAALPQVASVRGAGLILAAELNEGIDAKVVYNACLDAGLVVNAITPTALRLTPPLTVTEAEIDEAVTLLAQVLDGVLSGV
jgi:acetylornithine/N-succinyldiaminopimelate aminotransferase